MIRILYAVLSLTMTTNSANSVSNQDQLVDQSNVGLTKCIRLLSRFVDPKTILLIPFITASNLSTIGIDSSTSTSLLIVLTDSPSSISCLALGLSATDNISVSSSLLFFLLSSFCFRLKRLTIHLYSFHLRYPFASFFRHLYLRSWASTRTTLLHSSDATTASERLFLFEFFGLYYYVCIVCQRAVWCKT